MYRCMPPTPSSLWGTPLVSLGMKPLTCRPVVSVRYRPTVPLELARPLGKRADFEFKRSRADSHALAARTTIRARTWYSRRSWVLTYETPVASPCSSVTISRAIALVTIVSLPVLSAGGSRTDGDEKLECVAQPRPHCPQ